MIVIVDYGLGNVGSIQNMLVRCGADAVVSGDPAIISAASKLVLPGVGAFDTGMRELTASGLVPLLSERVLVGGAPLLGICLGMQMLGHDSEEGSEPGLGWLDARSVVFRFKAESEEKVPHMGWAGVDASSTHPLFTGLGPSASFYFSHSFYVEAGANAAVSATAFHGKDFPCAVGMKNIMGVQFHPEKSHRNGLKLLQNFADLI
jgi:glutamine amidotransferase